MSVLADTSGLSYQARARIADNLLVARRRAGLSQVTLEEIAMVTSGRISQFENGRVVGMLDTYVRLAGALGMTLDELLAGVQWTPGTIESEYGDVQGRVRRRGAGRSVTAPSDRRARSASSKADGAW